MRIVGLTGGIGSGKTTVAKFFKDFNIPVYIADDAGKKIMTSAEVRGQVIALLGEQAYKNEIPDKKNIASQVFTSAGKLEKLNQIIHPAVEKDFEAWKEKQSAPYLIYEAAILFETGSYKKCDAVILVTAPREDRILRLQKRDESTLEEIEARIANQWPDERKRSLADFEVVNQNLTFTKEQVRNLHEILLKPSKN